MAGRETGFAPVFDENSRVLVLGSFPSVQSRRTSFYYGNPQNRFWKMLANCFHAPMPETNDQKRAFVLSRGIALWDVVTECEIEGSKDDTIREYAPADLSIVFSKAKIELVLLNGKKAFSVFEENYKDGGVPYRLMPSTSPANPRYDEKIWKEAFDGVFLSH